MLTRIGFAVLSLVLMTACSGRVASEGADGGREYRDSGHPMADGAGHSGHDAAVGIDAGGAHDSGFPPPASHRPTHESCSTTRPSGVQDGGSPCTPSSASCVSDSECPTTNDAGGTNGRCTPFQHEGPYDGCPSCEYDQCSTDEACGTDSVCECGEPAYPGRFPNVCLTGNCQVDSDCGSGGYCSPDVGPCYEGTIGYYCHTANDRCNSDNDCQNQPSGGICVYDPSMKIWDCLNQKCPG